MVSSQVEMLQKIPDAHFYARESPLEAFPYMSLHVFSCTAQSVLPAAPTRPEYNLSRSLAASHEPPWMPHNYRQHCLGSGFPRRRQRHLKRSCPAQKLTTGQAWLVRIVSMCRSYKLRDASRGHMKNLAAQHHGSHKRSEHCRVKQRQQPEVDHGKVKTLSTINIFVKNISEK